MFSPTRMRLAIQTGVGPSLRTILVLDAEGDTIDPQDMKWTDEGWRRVREAIHQAVKKAREAN